MPVSRSVQTTKSEHSGRKAAQNPAFKECKVNWSWASTEQTSEKFQAVMDFSAFYSVSNILLLSFMSLYYANNSCISEAGDHEEKQR